MRACTRTAATMAWALAASAPVAATAAATWAAAERAAAAAATDGGAGTAQRATAAALPEAFLLLLRPLLPLPPPPPPHQWRQRRRRRYRRRRGLYNGRSRCSPHDGGAPGEVVRDAHVHVVHVARRVRVDANGCARRRVDRPHEAFSALRKGAPRPSVSVPHRVKGLRACEPAESVALGGRARSQKECPCSGGREGLRAPVLIGCD